MSRQSRREQRDMQHKHIWTVIDDYTGFRQLSHKVCFDYLGRITTPNDVDPPDPNLIDNLDPSKSRYDEPIPFTNRLTEEYVDNVPPT